MQKRLIVAVGNNGEIGKDNQLLWKKQKADMALFKSLTNNHAVVMGRNTWESIPEKFRPLPNRVNIVVSKTLSDDQTKGAILAGSIDEAVKLAEAQGASECWFIGGKGIYEAALPICSQLSITRIRKDFPDADTLFEKTLSLEEQGFRMTEVKTGEADTDNEHEYVIERWEK